MTIQSPNGFTVVELIVAIGIFTLITTAAIANFRGGSPGQELRLQTQNVASLMERARVQSLAGQEFNGQVPIGGYGVFVPRCATPPCQVQLFADLNNNFVIDDPVEVVEAVTLGQNVTVAAISTSSDINVLFKPPRPFVCFDGSCSGTPTVDITFGHRRDGQTKVMTVNQVSSQISY